jgi:beta-glucosidase
VIKTEFPKIMTCDMKKHESDEDIAKKVDALIKTMNEDEKLRLLRGMPDIPALGVRGNAAYNLGIPRLGVPEIRMYDGPAGVQSLYETTGFPTESTLGCTWDTDLAYRYGHTLGSENAAVSGNTQFGAQFDLIRTPFFSRGKDSFSEDQYLSSLFAMNETKGIQDSGVMTTAKHFFGYSQDIMPGATLIIHIDEQTMYEAYLTSFFSALKNGGASFLMTAYSDINGEYMTESAKYLKGILRDTWKWNGFTVNDWGCSRKINVRNGIDMETPLGKYQGPSALRKAISEKKISWADVIKADRHVLTGMGKAGLLSLVTVDQKGYAAVESGRVDPICMDTPYLRDSKELLSKGAELAREVACEGAVLLKNADNTLPLTEKDCSDGRVLLIGMGAEIPFCGEGQERSFGVLSEMTSPHEELEDLTGCSFKSEIGIDYIGKTIPVEYLFSDAECKKQGLTRTYGVTHEDGAYEMSIMKSELNDMFRHETEPYENQGEAGSGPFSGPSNAEGIWAGHKTGEIMETGVTVDLHYGTIDGKVNRTYRNSRNGNAMTNGQSCTYRGYLKAPETGTYVLNLCSVGGMSILRMDLGDGMKEIASTSIREGAQWPWSWYYPTPDGLDVKVNELVLEKDKVYPIQVACHAMFYTKDLAVRVTWVTPSGKRANAIRAVEAARSADKVVFFAWKPAGHDGNLFMPFKNQPFTSIELPRDQQRLLSEVSDALKNRHGKLAMVLTCGTALALGDDEELADAILYMAEPGECAGKAEAALLTGKVCPSGKLAFTFPYHQEDTPVTDTPEHFQERWLGEKKHGSSSKHVTYSEGLFFGYKWYDREDVRPQYPFGYGLSYTKFECEGVSFSYDMNNAYVKVKVTNTGSVPGKETVQCYIGKAEAGDRLQSVDKQLCAFEKTRLLNPGESQELSIEIDERLFCTWDPESKAHPTSTGLSGKWITIPGPRKLMIGTSSRNFFTSAIIHVK